MAGAMRVDELCRYCVRDNGWEEYGQSQPLPTWDQIEEAIRSLDRVRFVSVWLRADLDEENRAGRRLYVLGGRGQFAVECFVPGRHLCYCDDAKPDGAAQVRIWESNQGSYRENRYLCDDIAEVLRIARHFGRRGVPAPRVPWEQQ